MDGVDYGIIGAVLAGLLSFLSPCVLPLLPSYLAFITGMSLDELQAGKKRHATVANALLFVLGFSTVFIALGASASFVGGFIRDYDVWLERVGGAVIIVLGLHLIGVFRIPALMRERRMDLGSSPVGYLGAFGVGMAFGAGWTPCIGPVLGAILGYAVVQDTYWAGVTLLTAYSAGLGIPFMISALVLDRFLKVFARFKRFLPLVEKGSGGLLIVLGILLMTGRFTMLAAWLNQFAPEWLLDRI